MFDLGLHAGVDLLGERPRTARRRRHALTRPQRDVPGDRPLLVPRAPVQPLIAAIGPYGALIAVQPFVGHVDIGFMGRRRMHAVRQPQHIISADVQLRTEVPALAYARRLHLEVACARCVLGRARRGDDRGVHHRACAQH